MSVNFAYSNNNYSYEEYSDPDLLAQALGQPAKINDRSDEAFQVSPQDILSFGVQYNFETDFGRVTPRFDTKYSSERFFGIDNGSFDVYKENPSAAGDEAYAIIDLRLSWENPNGDTSASMYINNAADERYMSGSGAVADSIGTNTGSLAAPRTYGIDVRFSY